MCSQNEILGRAADLLEAASTSGQMSGVSASSQMFQFPRSPYLPAYSLSIPPIVTSSDTSNRMELSGGSSSPTMHKCHVSLSSGLSNDPYMTPSMESISTGLNQTGTRPLSCSISDDGKSNHSTSCGSVTPVSRCGSSDGTRHAHGLPQDHTSSSITPSQPLPPIHTHPNDHLQSSCSNSVSMDYTNTKPMQYFNSTTLANPHVQMCFPQGFGVFPPNTSVAHQGVQISSLPHFPTVGVSISSQVSSHDYVQPLELSTMGHCKPLSFNMMACMQNTNNNNMTSDLSGNAQNSGSLLQPAPSGPIIQPVAMFPIAGTSPHITTVPTLPPQSPGVYILPTGIYWHICPYIHTGCMHTYIRTYWIRAYVCTYWICSYIHSVYIHACILDTCIRLYWIHACIHTY